MCAEACVLANAAAGVDPAAAAQHILEPLLAALEAELPALAHAAGQLSKVGPGVLDAYLIGFQPTQPP